MEEEIAIDTKCSILYRKLCFRESVRRTLHRATIIVICSYGAIRSLEDMNIIVTTFLLYVVYRTLTEKKLYSIKTNLHKDEARQIIDKYFERWNYRKRNSNVDMAHYSEDVYLRGGYHYFVLPRNNEIMFTVIKVYGWGGMPSLVTLWTTRSSLKRLFRKHDRQP